MCCSGLNTALDAYQAGFLTSWATFLTKLIRVSEYLLGRWELLGHLYGYKQVSCFCFFPIWAKGNLFSEAGPGECSSCGCCGGNWIDFLSVKRNLKPWFPNVKPSNFPLGVSTLRVQCIVGYVGDWGAGWTGRVGEVASVGNVFPTGEFSYSVY